MDMNAILENRIEKAKMLHPMDDCKVEILYRDFVRTNPQQGSVPNGLTENLRAAKDDPFAFCADIWSQQVN